MFIGALTADQILAIPATEPERLFTGDPAVARWEYRKLVSAWHPDHNRDARAGAVFDRYPQTPRPARNPHRHGHPCGQ